MQATRKLSCRRVVFARSITCFVQRDPAVVLSVDHPRSAVKCQVLHAAAVSYLQRVITSCLMTILDRWWAAATVASACTKHQANKAPMYLTTRLAPYLVCEVGEHRCHKKVAQLFAAEARAKVQRRHACHGAAL